MAIQLEHELPSGVIANYWNISRLNLNFTDLSAVITMSLYADEEKRRNNKEYLLLRDFYISDITPYMFIEVNNIVDIAGVAYNLVKTDPFFQEAIDILEEGQELLIIPVNAPEMGGTSPVEDV